MGLIAIREDEDKAATVGVSTPTYKILAFVASAVFVGMAGGVYGYYIGFIDPLGMFNILLSVQIILAAAGRAGDALGPVLGAFIIEWLNETSNNEFGGGNARLLIFGGLLVLVVLFLPRGIIPTVDGWIERWRARQGRPAGERCPASTSASARRRAPVAPPRRQPLLEVQGPREALRRRARGRRRVVRGAGGLDHRADRAERLRQDDGLQPRRRHDVPDAGEVWFDGERIDGKPPGGARTWASGARSRSRACSAR